MSNPAAGDLEGLLNNLVDGTLTEDHEQVLADILRTNASARRYYRQFMSLHADLQWDYASAAVLQQETERSSPAERGRGGWAIAKWCSVAAALAVALFAALTVGWPRLFSPDHARSVIGRVAVVTGDVHLVDDGRQQLVTGEIELRSGSGVNVGGLTGLAVLRLDDGTEISLAGETHIECQRRADQTTVVLHEGNLSADVARQAAGRPLQIRTSNAQISVLGTRLAVGASEEESELGVQRGRVQLTRLTDGETIDVSGGQYAVVSRRVALEARPWPDTPETWSQDFEAGLPDGWRYGQWLRDGETTDARGVVRAARRFALNGNESDRHRITLPKRWMQGLWRVQDDTVLHFTYKMSRPGWFQIMMGIRSDDLNPAHVGNYELQSSYWHNGKTEPNQWRTASLPLSAFRKNIRRTEYTELPATSPRAGDVVYLLWFDTSDVDRGLVIDRIWIDRSSQPAGDTR